jgi:nucleoside-diphosphate-sugar epimerase
MVGQGTIKNLLAGGICKHIVCMDILAEPADFKARANAALEEHRCTMVYVRADITDKKLMTDPDGLVQQAFKNGRVEAVLHIAALVGPFFPTAAYRKVNFEGTLNVIAACRAGGVGALVDCSSPSTRFDGSDIEGLDENEVWASLGGVYQGIHEYASTKAMGEEAVLKASGDDLSTCAIAPHQVYGPSDRLFLPALLRTAKKGVLRVMGTGNNCVSMTHEENIAHALLLAAGAMVSHANWRKAGRPASDVVGRAADKVSGQYMVVTDSTLEFPAGLAINFWDAIDDATVRAGLGPIRSGWQGTMRLQEYFLLPIAYVGKLVTALTGRYVNITPFTVRMMIIDRYFDIGKATALLGYTPLKTFNDPDGWHAAVDAAIARVRQEDGW